MAIQVDLTVVDRVIQPVPPISVPPGGVSTIQWNVLTAPWTFPPTGSQYTGIVVKNGGSQFTSQGPSTDGKQYTYTDANQVHGPYEYTITLMAPGGAPITLDPTILNQE
jgi:hypothetical protein